MSLLQQRAELGLGELARFEIALTGPSPDALFESQGTSTAALQVQVTASSDFSITGQAAVQFTGATVWQSQVNAAAAADFGLDNYALASGQLAIAGQSSVLLDAGEVNTTNLTAAGVSEATFSVASLASAHVFGESSAQAVLVGQAAVNASFSIESESGVNFISEVVANAQVSSACVANSALDSGLKQSANIFGDGSSFAIFDGTVEPGYDIPSTSVALFASSATASVDAQAQGTATVNLDGVTVIQSRFVGTAQTGIQFNTLSIIQTELGAQSNTQSALQTLQISGGDLQSSNQAVAQIRISGVQLSRLDSAAQAQASYATRSFFDGRLTSQAQSATNIDVLRVFVSSSALSGSGGSSVNLHALPKVFAATNLLSASQAVGDFALGQAALSRLTGPAQASSDFRVGSQLNFGLQLPVDVLIRPQETRGVARPQETRSMVQI